MLLKAAEHQKDPFESLKMRTSERYTDVFDEVAAGYMQEDRSSHEHDRVKLAVAKRFGKVCCGKVQRANIKYATTTIGAQKREVIP